MKSKSAFHQPQPEPPTTLLTPRNPEGLQWEMQQVQLAIARRAYELFELRGREHGHDCEDWFRAESELLRPVSVSRSESADLVSIRVNVLGFEEKELEVSIEPHRIAILGKKARGETEVAGSKVEYIDRSPDQIFRFIDLATEVLPRSSVVELQAGVLTFDLPKAPKPNVEAAAPAA